MKRILIIGGAKFEITAPLIQSDQMLAHNGQGQVALIALPKTMLVVRAEKIEVTEAG